MFPIMKRAEAAERGLKRYYTGNPCSKGHDSQRFTSTGVCVKCAAGYVKKYSQRLNQELAARSQGLFIYKLHPDDHAAALAYCQALDMTRGRQPQTPAPIAPAAPIDIVRARTLALGRVVDMLPASPSDPYLPAP